MVRTKIAFSGAGGTGKGTILSIVQKEFPHIIPIKSPMESLTKCYLGDRKNYLDGSEEELKTKRWMGLGAQFWAERNLNEAGRSFISERSCLDYLAYWNQQLDYDKNYHDLAVKGCFNYNIVFYFPCDFENTEKEKNEHS